MQYLIDHATSAVYGLAKELAQLGPDVSPEDLIPLWRRVAALESIVGYLQEESEDYRPLTEIEKDMRDAQRDAVALHISEVFRKDL